MDDVLHAQADRVVLRMAAADGLAFDWPLHHAVVQADLDGLRGIGFGVVGGYIPKFSLFSSLLAGIGPGGGGGIDLELILGPPDADLDGDGCADAYSFGMYFEASSATIEGVADIAEDAPAQDCDLDRGSASCEQGLACALDCPADDNGGVDSRCISCCFEAAHRPGAASLELLLGCPAEQCAEAADATACMEQDHAAPLAACRADQGPPAPN